MQPSESEIKREVEALRDIRRRSTNPLTIDPDLPNQSGQVPNVYWNQQTSPTDGDSSSENDHSGSSNAEHDSHPDTPNNPADDPFRLFWLPASLHPEIAPAEFRAFLNEHARTPPTEDQLPSRSNSISSMSSGSSMPPSLSSSSSLGRKKSMLSRQYKPSVGDGVENADEVVVKRNRSSIYSVNRNTGPQLTINDLQKLEKLAEEASESDDPSRLRSILRRSLSLNVSPSEDDFSDFGDEADIPVIVPPPGQILRRAARTKIRKPGLPGDGGGHRFGASRRGARSDSGHTPAQSDLRDDSSSDHGDSSVEYIPPLPRPRTFSLEDPPAARPDSFSEEASIYDAYARGDDEDDEHESSVPSPMLVVPPDTQPHEIDLPLSPAPTPASLLEALGPVLHQPQPQRLLAPSPLDGPHQRPSRTPSPDTSSHEPASPSPSHSPPSQRLASPNQQQQQHYEHNRKDKDKKGLFGKWGADKGGKKGQKDKDREREKEIRERAEKEKESGFFGSLFGSKKKQDEPSGGGLSSSTGREAAQALLGASKAYVPSPSPVGSMGNNNGNLSPYARYPIHVERAIYRLSHIKLSNPRRPLYEQVLISNLMFWYLGVINKPATPDSPPTEEKAPPLTEKQAKEKEQKERDEHRQRAEKERLEREQKEREQREREAELAAKKREQSPSGRRAALTKPSVNGPARRAEQPVKGTQYDQQHRVIEQEYVGFNSNNGQSSSNHPVPRTGSAPPQVYNRPQAVKMQAPSQPEHHYHNGEMQQQQNQYNLPPGAMPPAGNDQPWRTPPQSAPRQHSSARSKSPPQPQAQNRYNESLQSGNRPSRAHSATAAPVSLPPANGHLRKGRSAHAVISPAPIPPDEDVPLAVWQQQRRK